MTKSSLLVSLALLANVAQASVNTTANQIGRLTSVGNELTRTFNEYDAQGRIVGTQYVQDGQSRTFVTAYGYPQNSSSMTGPGTVVLSQTFPDGEKVSYSYDLSSKQVTVRSTMNGLTDDVVRDVRSNARGQVTRLEFGNGVAATLTYDDAGHLQLIRSTSVNAAGQTVQDYTYTYDQNGNVTGMADGVRTDQSATFEYDTQDQLTVFRSSSGSIIESYAYDPIGNLTQKGALTQTYGAGGRPHALAVSAGIPYGYDANGNVITIGPTTTIDWNAENMAKTITAGSVIADKSFVGETLWKKFEQGVTTYYLPSLRIENGVARKYYGAFAERLEQAGDRQLRFYHPDHLGSSSVMTDQGGGVIRRASYFPWGGDRGVDGTFIPKLQFNFKEKDASGFYDYGARLYSPLTGRWLSPDTSLKDGMNRYAYARNNPWSRIDIDGHQSNGRWIECIAKTCQGVNGILTVWLPEGDTPEGWRDVKMESDGRSGIYTPPENRTTIRRLVAGGTVEQLADDGRWKDIGRGSMPTMTSAQAAEYVKPSEVKDLQAETLGAIGNAVDKVPMAVAQAYLASVAVGAAAGLAAYALISYGIVSSSSMITGVVDSTAPVYTHEVTAVGARVFTQAFEGIANTLNWSRWTPLVNLDWIRNIAQAGGPVLVYPGGFWTHVEMWVLMNYGYVPVDGYLWLKMVP